MAKTLRVRGAPGHELILTQLPTEPGEDIAYDLLHRAHDQVQVADRLTDPVPALTVCELCSRKLVETISSKIEAGQRARRKVTALGAVMSL